MEQTADAARRGRIRDVAREAGVSLSTVSNVLNNPGIVATPTRERVEQAMAAVGFIRNGVARQLRGSPSSMVGGILVDLSNPFYAEVARGIQDRLAEDGCLAILCSTDVQVDREREFLVGLQGLGVRGVLLNSVDPRVDELIRIDRRGTRVVLLDDLGDGESLNAVGLDNLAGGGLAADHLLDLGHRRIAVLRARRELASLRNRAEGARAAVTARGLDASAVLVDVVIDHPRIDASARAAVEQILAMRPRPTAVMALNDLAAVGVLRGLRERSVSVPGEISLVGYDDLAFAAVTAPALTTVAQPSYELGRRAADVLLAAQDGGAVRVVRFEPRLVVRASTGPVDALLARGGGHV